MTNALIAAEYNRRTEEFTTALHNINSLGEWVNDLIGRMPEMSDEQLNLAISASHELEKQAFRIRGAATAQLQQRMRIRSTGLKREERAALPSMREQLSSLAEDLGVDARTLYTDAQIHRTFFAPPAAPPPAPSPVDEFFGEDGAQQEEIVDADNSVPEGEGALTLDREYYAIALTAPDPKVAIEIAFRKIGTPGFSSRQFRHDVEALRQAASSRTPAPTETIEETYIQTVRIPLEMRSRIAQQCRARNTDVDSLFVALLQGRGLLPAEIWAGLEAQIKQVYPSMTPVQFLSDLIRNNETLLVKRGRMTPVLTAPVRPIDEDEE